MMPKSLQEHLFLKEPKRVLSLDGGGVRGLITLGMLKHVEDTLKERSGRGDEFRLSDYFDLIGGTSTGALMATLLALGETVDEITRLYFDMCPRIFRGSSWIPGIRSKFDPKGFDAVMRHAFAEVLAANRVKPHEPTMDTTLLRTGLAIATKRIDTGSVWMLSNNPRHKFWDSTSEPWKDYWAARPDEAKFYAGRSYALRKVAQASASAPYYLDAVDIDISPEERGLFFDGGASPCNNPSSELFIMTTLRRHARSGQRCHASPYGFEWSTGADNLFMLSLGTGMWRDRQDVKNFRKQWAVGKAIHALRGIISDAETASVVFMQSISESAKGQYINRALEDMQGLRIVDEPLLTYHRANVRLEPDWLRTTLGEEFAYSSRVINKLKQMDLAEQANLNRCHAIGLAYGARSIDQQTFPAAFDNF
ncbi:MAG: patatin-like phospholipase family protein [Alphaproteobacteria bacterium]|nr:patatin-like phospholipase family protein [Alphaproteobacteria bacterium]